MGSLSNRSFADIPNWTYEGSAPGKHTFFSAISLAGLECKRIRLSAADQRALLGHPVFGKRTIIVDGQSGTVTSIISTGFGQDFEKSVYAADLVQQAANHKKELRPGYTGPKYFRCSTAQQG